MPLDDRAPGRRGIRLVPRALSTLAGFRVLAVATMIGLWVIVPSGALVRLTGSGLGCPDWPLCNGGVIPETGYHAVIEYSNRIFSAVVMVLTVVTWLAARRLPGRPAAPRRLAGAVALMTLGQAPLGGLTVLSDLHPLMVSSHFVLSLAALATAVLLVFAASDLRNGVRRGWNPRRSPMAVLTALSLGVVIVTGVLVTAAGPHSGDPDVVDRYGDLQDAASLHVRAVGVFVVLLLTLAVWLWRERPADPWAGRLILAFLPLLAAQITIGEIQYRTGLPWQVVAVHVSIAGLLWAVGTALAWAVARPPLPTPADAPPAEARAEELVGV